MFYKDIRCFILSIHGIRYKNCPEARPGRGKPPETGPWRSARRRWTRLPGHDDRGSPQHDAGAVGAAVVLLARSSARNVHEGDEAVQDDGVVLEQFFLDLGQAFHGPPDGFLGVV